MNIIAVALYVMGLLAISTLIYRYWRYSNWRSTRVGRAFMQMKVALWFVLAFVSAGVFFHDWHGWTRDTLRILMIGYANYAIISQVRLILAYQGGWLRRKPIQSELVEDIRQSHLPRI